VENNFLTALTGQSTHEDLVENPACGAFCLKSLACGAFYFIKNLAAAHSFHKNPLLNHSGMHFISSFLFCLPIH